MGLGVEVKFWVKNCCEDQESWRLQYMRGHAGASGREMWSRAGNRGAVVLFVAEGLIPHTVPPPQGLLV